MEHLLKKKNEKNEKQRKKEVAVTLYFHKRDMNLHSLWSSLLLAFFLLLLSVLPLW